MNLRDLEYLVAVAEHKHFGKAAQAVFATQPTLSMQIKKLEQELGVKLLERTNRRVLITELGQKVAAHAQVVLRGANEIRTMTRDAKDPYSGKLKLGLFPTLAPYLLPHIVPGLMKKYPSLKLILREEKTDILIRRLEDGEIDAAFLALPVKEDFLEHRLLFEEEFFLATAKSNRWPDKKTLKRSDIKGKQLLLLEEGHCLRDQALEFCSHVNVSEFPDFRASSMETLRQMVAANVGMTLIPKLAMRKNDGITYTPFSKPKPARRIALYWRKSSIRKKLLDSLCDELQKLLPRSI
ncbi:MAG: LysR substrate-binding domain-containing protein [Elusimicrobiota bacterium]